MVNDNNNHLVQWFNGKEHIDLPADDQCAVGNSLIGFLEMDSDRLLQIAGSIQELKREIHRKSMRIVYNKSTKL